MSSSPTNTAVYWDWNFKEEKNLEPHWNDYRQWFFSSRHYLQLISDQKLAFRNPHVMRLSWSELRYIFYQLCKVVSNLRLTYSVCSICFYKQYMIVKCVPMWQTFSQNESSNIPRLCTMYTCTHVTCIQPEWPTSHLPTYQQLTLRLLSDTWSSCSLVYSCNIYIHVTPHVGSFVYFRLNVYGIHVV